MTLSRQENSLTNGGRANQRARTRTALTRAAAELIAEGQPPSMPAAAERALVSVATAYRYFPTAEELWEEAVFSTEDHIDDAAVERAVAAAGDDVEARLEVVVREIGWKMLEEQLRYRQMAKTSLDRWFAQQRHPDSPSQPTRPGRRNRWNELAVEPLRDSLGEDAHRALVEALGFGWGTEAVIVLYDVLQLDTEAAKARMLTTCRWILRGALADGGV